MSTKEVVTAENLRVLIVTPCFHVIDGVSLTVRDMRNAVHRLGGQVKVCTAQAGKEDLRSDPYYDDLIFCPSTALPYDSTDNYALCKYLDDNTKAEILNYNPNVFHITSPDILSFSICEWTRKNKIPLVGTWHSNLPDYLDHVGPAQKFLLKPVLTTVMKGLYSYPLVTYVPQVSLRDRLRKEGYETEEAKNKLGVFGGGVDLETFHPTKRSEEVRMKYNVKPNQIALLWVGRCVQEKRPDIWMDVVRRLEQKYPGKVVGLVVGRGEYFNEMINLKNVVGVGWLNKPELSELYASSDLILFPSGVETFGNVTLEAMASGTPCVVNSGCSSHLINEKNQNGFACENREGFFRACEKLVLDEKLRSKMGLNARRIANDEWGMDFIMNQMVQNYVDAANWSKEDMPDLHLTRKMKIAKAFYVFIDVGGLPLLTVVASALFYWKNLDQTLYKIFYFVAFLVAVRYLSMSFLE